MKVNVNRIIFQRRHGEYVYEITTLDVRIKYNGMSVFVRYTEDDLKRGEAISLWDIETDNFIDFCYPQKQHHVAQVNMTDADWEILRDRKKIKNQHLELIKQRAREVEENSLEWMNHLNASKNQLLDAEEYQTLQRMMPDVKMTDSNVIAIEGEDGKAKLYGSRKRIDPHGKVQQVPDHRLEHFMEVKDEVIEEVDRYDISTDRLMLGMDEPETIMEVEPKAGKR